MAEVTSQTLQTELASAFPAATEVRAGFDGKQAAVVVVDDKFDGLSRVKRQQAVYQVLNQFIADGRVHAVNIETFSRSEWDKVKMFR